MQDPIDFVTFVKNRNDQEKRRLLAWQNLIAVGDISGLYGAIETRLTTLKYAELRPLRVGIIDIDAPEILDNGD